MRKPDCKCWQDPKLRHDKELRVDAIGSAIQASIQQAVADLQLCPETCAYVAGSAMAGIVFWVAYVQRGDGKPPTTEQLAQAEVEVIASSRERLNGARSRDVPTTTGSIH